MKKLEFLLAEYCPNGVEYKMLGNTASYPLRATPNKLITIIRV